MLYRSNDTVGLSLNGTHILQASVYGKCIVADYNAAYHDKCLTEFMRLKNCYLVSGQVCPKSPNKMVTDLCQGCSEEEVADIEITFQHFSLQSHVLADELKSSTFCGSIPLWSTANIAHQILDTMTGPLKTSQAVARKSPSALPAPLR